MKNKIIMLAVVVGLGIAPLVSQAAVNANNLYFLPTYTPPLTNDTIGSANFTDEYTATEYAYPSGLCGSGLTDCYALFSQGGASQMKGAPNDSVTQDVNFWLKDPDASYGSGSYVFYAGDQSAFNHDTISLLLCGSFCGTGMIWDNFDANGTERSPKVQASVPSGWNMYTIDWTTSSTIDLYVNGVDVTSTTFVHNPSYTGSEGTWFSGSPNSTNYPYNSIAACLAYNLPNFNGGSNPTWTSGDITTLFNGGTPPANCLGSGGGGGSPNLSFVYPIEGSDTNLFSPYLLSLSDLPSTHTCYVSLQWQLPYNQTQGAGYEQQNCGSMENDGIQIPFTGFPQSVLNADLENLPMSAYAFVWDTTVDPQTNNVLASTSVAFNINSNNNSSTYQLLQVFTQGDTSGTEYFLTSSTAANPFQSNYSGACALPSSTDIGGGIYYAGCSLLSLAFTPNSNAASFLQNGAVSLENVMPFQLVFGFLNQLNTLTGSSSAPSESDLTYSITLAANQTSSLPLVNSSTLSNSFGSANKTLIFQWEDYFMYIFTLLAIVGSVYEGIHIIAGMGKHKKVR